jgi:hypothetical protein
MRFRWRKTYSQEYAFTYPPQQLGSTRGLTGGARHLATSTGRVNARVADQWGPRAVGPAWPRALSSTSLLPARQRQGAAPATSSGATGHLRRGYGHRRDRGGAPHPSRLGTDAEEVGGEQGLGRGGRELRAPLSTRPQATRGEGKQQGSSRGGGGGVWWLLEGEWSSGSPEFRRSEAAAMVVDRGEEGLSSSG